MNLLGSANYDPTTAVSKATSALLAMTALDTTNLRVAITVPAHGKIYVRMMCTIVGATTVPAILLGVLNGATVVGRVAPQIYTGTNSAATSQATAFAEFVVTGLTPGAMSLDAAYAVQVIVASTNIKFGGPNNTTGANGWGAFVFEVWDPQPMPLAIAPGAAGGLLIAGANAATTFATLTSTGALSINGVSNVSQTGDSFARLGAPVGASTSADIALVQADTDNIQTRLPAALISGHMDSSVTVNNDKTGYTLSAPGVQAIWDALTSALTTVGSIGKLLATNIDALISSRSTFAGGAVASVTGAVGSVTGAVGSVTGAVGSVTAAVTVGTNNDKTGYSLTQSFPANFAALGISVGGHISLVDTLTTYTGNVVQTGDAFARIGLAGVGLTNLGDARIANLDATVSSRLATSGYTAPDNADVVSIKSTLGVAGAGLTALGDTRIANLDATVSSRLASASYTAPPTAAANAAAVWNEATAGHVTAGTFGKLLNDDLDTNIGSRLATSGYTAPDNADIVSIKSTLGVAGAGLTALGDTRIAHLDADVSSRLATSGYTAPPSSATIAGQVWDIVLSGHLTSGTTGSALNAAGAAGDPWTTTLPGVYGAGTAGNIVGNRLDAAVSTRLATSGYTAPDNADITSIKSTLGVAGAGLTALGDARVAHLDADVSSRLATAGYTAPDNADIAAIKSKTDNLPPDPADASDIVASFAAISSAISALNNLSAAGVRTAVGLAAANLDTQLGNIQTTVNGITGGGGGGSDPTTLAAIAAVQTAVDNLPTNAELATALAGADDATLAAIATLTSSVPTAVAVANEVASRVLNANIKEVNNVTIKGDGAATPWGPV